VPFLEVNLLILCWLKVFLELPSTGPRIFPYHQAQNKFSQGLYEHVLLRLFVIHFWLLMFIKNKMMNLIYLLSTLKLIRNHL
jgi:hypothetical protein